MNDISIDDLPETDVRIFFDLDHPFRRGLRESDWKDFSSKELFIRHEIDSKENELKLLEGNFTPRKENRQGVSLKTYQKNKDSLLKIGLEKEFLSHQFIDEFINCIIRLPNNQVFRSFLTN